MSADIDPITLAVLAGRMEQIADEMDATLFRAAFNPIIAEAHDASHGLYHAVSGDTLVQGKSGLPIFVGVMSFAVKAVIDKAAQNGDLEDGDIYIFNDAHVGGTHLSDMRLVRPYYHEGQLFCYLASVGHWHDVGGAVPGNYNPAATDAFQEAFILPPVRLAKAGVIQTDIIDILMRNTRLPQSAQGDLNGQLGALDLGVKRMDELLAEYGAATVSAGLDALQDRAEALMRAELTGLPDGRWEAVDYLDNDGITDVALPIKVALEISGDTMTLDFEGTAARCAGPVNIALPTAVATAYVAIKHIFPALPANAGVMRPITVKIPEGSLLSAPFPAPVGGYTETIFADDRRDLCSCGWGSTRAGRGKCLRHDQRTLDLWHARQWQAVGDVQLLWRWPWWILWRGRVEPRQCAHLYRHDPANGNSGSGLSRNVQAVGLAARQCRCRHPPRRHGRGLRDRSAGRKRRQSVPVWRARTVRANRCRGWR
jgi:N-methylhydantoinase B